MTWIIVEAVLDKTVTFLIITSWREKLGSMFGDKKSNCALLTTAPTEAEQLMKRTSSKIAAPALVDVS